MVGRTSPRWLASGGRKTVADGLLVFVRLHLGEGELQTQRLGNLAQRIRADIFTCFQTGYRRRDTPAFAASMP